MDAEMPGDIKNLLEATLREHRLSGSALTESALRFAAVRLIVMHHRLLRQLDPLHVANGNDASTAMLAACLYILFVQEKVVHDRDTILSFGVDMVYDLLCRLCAHVDETALRDAVSRVDQDGYSTWMAKQPGHLAPLYCTSPPSGELTWVASQQRDRRKRDQLSDLIPESAALDRLPRPFHSVIQNTIMTRTSLMSFLCCCVTFVYFFLLASNRLGGTTSNVNMSFALFFSCMHGEGLEPCGQP